MSLPPQPPEAHPIAHITVSLSKTGYKKLSCPINNAIWRQTQLSPVADTAAQTCTAGRELLTTLNIPNICLLKTRHRLEAVNNQDLSILGALVLEITHTNSKSIEIVYICE